MPEESSDRSGPRHPDARRIAFDIVTRVETTEAYANVLLDARLQASRLGRPDRALATELVYGILRWQGRLDWLLAPCLDRPVEALDPPVRRLLRLGAYQLTRLDRVPAFAAVDATVTLAREVGAGRAAGFVNAVLRRLARTPAPQTPEPARELIAYWTGPGSHPEWLVRRWLERLGPEEAAALMESNNRVAPLTVLANRLAGPPGESEDLIRRAAPGSTPGRFVPGSFRLRGVGSPRELPGFAEGRFLPMDEAGALPVLALDLAPGHRVLDACAGGGGKTALIAGTIGPAGEVLALDHSARAIRRLSEAVTRLGLATVRVAIYDAREAGRQWADAFPRVLVDAPCSGLGTLRRRPEIKWRRQPEDLRRAALLQGALLDGVAGAVAPGGLLVYSTCSLEPEETDEVIDAFLARRPEFTPETAGPALDPFVDPAARGRMRAWPHRHETDGFFIARLRRGA